MPARRPLPHPSAMLLALLCLDALDGAPARAAERPVSLPEIIRAAVASNLDLQRERVALRVADANLLAAEGRFDVTLTGGLTFSQRVIPVVTMLDISSGVSTRLDLSVGLQRQLESGGRVAVSVGGSRDETSARAVCDPGEATCSVYDADINLRFDHPLLRGFGSEFARATLDRRKLELGQSMLNRQARVATVLRDIAGGYWELAFASQDLSIRRSAVDLARKQLEVTQAQIEVGRLAPIDRAPVERAIADRLQDVAVAEQNLVLRGLTLRRLAGQPIDLDAGASPWVASEFPRTDPAPVDLGAELTRALERNPQLRALRAGVALTEIDVATARSLVRPQLDAFVQVGNRGRSKEADEALSQVAGLDNFTWLTGLSFQAPVQNRAARGQLEAARATRERVELDAAALELDIREAVVRFGTQVATATRRLELARQTVQHATRSLQGEEAQFQVGRSTNNDVLLRQQELKVAESQVVRATVDLLLAEIALQALTGELLDRYGVTIAAR